MYYRAYILVSEVIRTVGHTFKELGGGEVVRDTCECMLVGVLLFSILIYGLGRMRSYLL